jgi:hypothetical protein
MLAGETSLNLTKKSHNIEQATTVLIPACADGDIGVFIAIGSGGSAGSVPSAISAPSGWAELAPVGGIAFGSGDRQRVQVFRKIMAASDEGVSLTGLNGATSRINAVFVFGGDRPVETIADGGVAGQVTSGDPAAVVVAAGSAARAGVFVMNVHQTRTGDTKTVSYSPTTYTETMTDTDNRARYTWLTFPDGEAEDTTVDVNDAGVANAFAAWFIEAE